MIKVIIEFTSSDETKDVAAIVATLKKSFPELNTDAIITSMPENLGQTYKVRLLGTKNSDAAVEHLFDLYRLNSNMPSLIDQMGPQGLVVQKVFDPQWKWAPTLLGEDAKSSYSAWREQLKKRDKYDEDGIFTNLSYGICRALTGFGHASDAYDEKFPINGNNPWLAKSSDYGYVDSSEYKDRFVSEVLGGRLSKLSNAPGSVQQEVLNAMKKALKPEDRPVPDEMLLDFLSYPEFQEDIKSAAARYMG